MRRRMIMAAMRQGYKFVEYIQGTGEQFIVTNIINSVNHKVEIELSHTGGQMGYKFEGLIMWVSPVHAFINGDLGTISSQPKEVRQTYTIDGFTQSIYGDIRRTGTFSDVDATFCIFKRGYHESWAVSGAGRCYGMKSYDRDGNLEADLRPCVEYPSRVAGIYDLVSGVFYTNAGTGEFIVGPDV